MELTVILLAAVVIDFVVGDPRSLPHYVRYVGTWIVQAEPVIRSKFHNERVGGLVLLLSTQFVALGAYLGIRFTFGLVSDFLVLLFDVFVVFQSIAFRDLIHHIQKVLDALRIPNMQQARKAISWVVGRDTGGLDEEGVSRASVETLAESFNDGVVAPLFWAILLGPVGAILFRVSNTLDSMVGYQNQKYRNFGTASARWDDVLAFVPARIAFLCMAVAGKYMPSKSCIKDAQKHKSPNAGWTESICAYILNIRLGGINFYKGVEKKLAYMNIQGSPADSKAIGKAIRLLYKSYGVLLLIIIAVGFLRLS